MCSRGKERPLRTSTHPPYRARAGRRNQGYHLMRSETACKQLGLGQRPWCMAEPEPSVPSAMVPMRPAADPSVSSIDVRIETSLNEHPVVVVAKREAKHRARIAARTVEVNAWLAARGLPPVHKARKAEMTDPIYQIPRKGRTLADYPALVLQYEPLRNGGSCRGSNGCEPEGRPVGLQRPSSDAQRA